MCTVTYIPPRLEQRFILTSNRDEKEFRPTSPPEVFLVGNQKIAFPKDENAGGSWIAINEGGKVCCLLNGGTIPHQKEEHHTISRGIILLEFTASELSSHEYFAARTLQQVEPFTMVTIEQRNGIVDSLTEFIWDGQNKHFSQLDKNSPYIWSSVTLYNPEHREMRKEWFNRFYTEFRNEISPENIYTFHSEEHTKDDSVNVIMEREGGLKTVSITQVTPKNGQLHIFYSDLLKNSKHELSI